MTGFKVRIKVRMMFWRPKDDMKSKCYSITGYEERNKLCLMYLEFKAQQKRYGWCMFELKWQKTAKRTYSEGSKEETRYRRYVWILRSSRKGNNCVFGFCQQTTKVQCMCLASKNLKISCKKCQQWSER